jgi:CPA2 family monovalent cation:H+ antiporter-2
MFSALELTLLLLFFALLGVIAFRMLQLPPMLGYLIVGILLGPHAIGVVPGDDMTHDTTHTLAEFGVVFLMFSIGLEFSFPKLMAMRRVVFGLGMVQVVITIVVTMVFCALVSWQVSQMFKLGWQAAFAIGGALAMSSTAIVSKMLTERLELDSEHGRKIMGILLFQDLAVVPLLILIPALANNTGNLASTLGWASAKALIVLFLLFFLGQRLVRKWFHLVVKRRTQELFMLNLLFVTLGAAWITEKAGLSLELGAFVAGMLISETEFKHQVEEDIKPFRDVLLGLFFITVGMKLDLSLVLRQWWVVLAILAGIVLLKFCIIALIAKLFGANDGTSMRSGLALAQGGEFGFVLLTLMSGLNMAPPLVIQLILAAMVLSMLLAPFIITQSDRIVLRFSANEWMMQSLALTQIASRTMAKQKHVIIAGFGRNGQSLAKLLEAEKVLYHALDTDPERVQEAQAAGANVSYGDAARRESLTAAGVMRAAAMVITYEDTASALRILHLVHEMNPMLQVIVRSYDDTDLEKLKAAGAAEVVPEALESSLMLASHALVMIGIPLRRVVHLVQQARNQRYALLSGFFPGAGDVQDDDEHTHVRLHSVLLSDSAAAIGQPLGQFELQEVGAEVTLVRRGKERLEAGADFVFQAGDVVVLRGAKDAVQRAEARLLK